MQFRLDWVHADSDLVVISKPKNAAEKPGKLLGFRATASKPNDKDHLQPDENPGAAVVSAFGTDDVRWAIVTNGKLWRLYSKDAHSRATNFYEVDLEEALAASDETDPNETFRYWWLFFRAEAFQPCGNRRPRR